LDKELDTSLMIILYGPKKRGLAYMIRQVDFRAILQQDLDSLVVTFLCGA
jgi:hypothetical protein